MTSKPIKPANAAFAAAFLMFAALCGAWYFEYVLKYAPCPLCYQQRIPYYFAIPLGLAIAAFALYGANRSILRIGLYLLALVLLARTMDLVPGSVILCYNTRVLSKARSLSFFYGNTIFISHYSGLQRRGAYWAQFT